MRITNNYDLPESYWRGCAEQRPHLPKQISITELLQPPQMRQLRKAHPDIEKDCADMIELFFGTAVHERLERFAPSNADAERTMTWYDEDSDWTITGTPDLTDGGVLTDWKTTRVRALQYDREEWEQQVNLYDWLLGMNHIAVTSMVVWAFLKDFDPQKRGEDNYPSAPLVKIPVKQWDLRRQTETLFNRLRLHVLAEERGIYGDCTPAERWQRDTWAVYKKGMDGRARAVFSEEVQAREYAYKAAEKPRDWHQWFEISHRPGEPVRCKDWCDVRSICPQWQAERPNTLLEDLEGSVRMIEVTR